LTENRATIALIAIVAVLITGIWAVEWRDRGSSVVPIAPKQVSVKAPVKAKAQVKAQVKAKQRAKVKRVTRAHVRTFTAPQTGSNRLIGKRLAAQNGWTGEQWQCLNNLWQKESGWSIHSTNASGTAGGIPQALPASKMASAGKDWRTNAVTQITWGIGYINNRYGSACKAWAHWQSHNWD